MKVYIDFDRTMFDCDRFIEDFYNLIENYNISRDSFIKYQNQCKNFNPYDILELMNNEKDISDDIYDAIGNLVKKSSNYLFSDTIPFLKYLKNKNYQVIILTRGNYNFQMNKIINSNIDLYYDSIIVTQYHKGELDIDYGNSIFIDDKIEEIESILSKKPKRIISIQRNGVNNINSNIEIITSLNELINNI